MVFWGGGGVVPFDCFFLKLLTLSCCQPFLLSMLRTVFPPFAYAWNCFSSAFLVD